MPNLTENLESRGFLGGPLKNLYWPRPLFLLVMPTKQFCHKDTKQRRLRRFNIL